MKRIFNLNHALLLLKNIAGWTFDSLKRFCNKIFETRGIGSRWQENDCGTYGNCMIQQVCNGYCSPLSSHVYSYNMCSVVERLSCFLCTLCVGLIEAAEVLVLQCLLLLITVYLSIFIYASNLQACHNLNKYDSLTDDKKNDIDVSSGILRGVRGTKKHYDFVFNVSNSIKNIIRGVRMTYSGESEKYEVDREALREFCSVRLLCCQDKALVSRKCPWIFYAEQRNVKRIKTKTAMNCAQIRARAIRDGSVKRIGSRWTGDRIANDEKVWYRISCDVGLDHRGHYTWQFLESIFVEEEENFFLKQKILHYVAVCILARSFMIRYICKLENQVKSDSVRLASNNRKVGAKGSASNSASDGNLLLEHSDLNVDFSLGTSEVKLLIGSDQSIGKHCKCERVITCNVSLRCKFAEKPVMGTYAYSYFEEDLGNRFLIFRIADLVEIRIQNIKQHAHTFWLCSKSADKEIVNSLFYRSSFLLYNILDTTVLFQFAFYWKFPAINIYLLLRVDYSRNTIAIRSLFGHLSQGSYKVLDMLFYNLFLDSKVLRGLTCAEERECSALGKKYGYKKLEVLVQK